MKPQTQAIAGAATGSAFLVGGLIAPILWALYVIIAIGVVQPARTRSLASASGQRYWQSPRSSPCGYYSTTSRSACSLPSSLPWTSPLPVLPKPALRSPSLGHNDPAGSARTRRRRPAGPF